jgi:site-specific recombinase XerD
MPENKLPAPGVGELTVLLPSWRLHPEASNLSPRTIRAYTGDGALLVAFMTARGMPTAVLSIRREHVEAFIVAELERTSSSSAATRYRSLQQLFKWLDDEGEIDKSPMAKMRPPKIPEKPVPVLSDDHTDCCWRTARVRTSATGGTAQSSGCSSIPACASKA